MSENLLAFIFPAFASDYSDHTGQGLPGFEDQFVTFLKRASTAVDPELAGFSFHGTTFLEHELRTQYLSYLYSCAAAKTLRLSGYRPDFIAGYSMGIYAALFDAGSLSFEAGLELIRIAYESLSSAIAGRRSGMGALIGLDRNDLEKLIAEAKLQVEITNQNAEFSFVVSGEHSDLETLLDLAITEGALNTRNLNVSIPYHSQLLESAANEFERQITKIPIHTPETVLVSTIDQALLTTRESIRFELSRNLYCPLNWFKTMQFMLDFNVSRFIECGPSKGPVKNSRFIKGEFNFSPLNKI